MNLCASFTVEKNNISFDIIPFFSYRYKICDTIEASEYCNKINLILHNQECDKLLKNIVIYFWKVEWLICKFI